MACWAKIKPESEFYPIFNNIDVPIQSLVPFVPRSSGNPLCYMVLVNELPVTITEQLAQKLFELWQSECKSYDAARNYILKGLPMKTSHFQSVISDDHYQMQMGAAINIAAHSSQSISSPRNNCS